MINAYHLPNSLFFIFYCGLGSCFDDIYSFVRCFLECIGYFLTPTLWR